MSELDPLRSAYQAVYEDLQSVLEAPMAQLHEEVNSDGLFSLIKAAYPYNPLMDTDESARSAFNRSFATEGYMEDPANIESLLGAADITVEVPRAISSAFLAKFAPNQEKLSDDLTFLVRPFRQGQEKIFRTVKEAGERDDSDEDAEAQDIIASLVPLWLALVAAECASQVDGDKAETIRSLQEVASAIMESRQNVLLVTKDMTPAEEIYTRALNMLSSLYWRGKDVDFYTRFVEQDYDVIVSTDDDIHIDPGMKDGAEQTARTFQKHAAWVREDARMFGITNLDVDGIIDNRMRRNNPTRGKVKRRMAEYIANGSGDILGAPMANYKWKQEAYLEELRRKRGAFIVESQRVLIARNLIQMMAAGSFDWESINRFEALAESQPLKELFESKPVPERYTEWEIIPPAIGQGESRQCGERSDEPKQPQGVDMGRRDKMYDFVRLWGEGYVARSRIPNLKEDEQYYVAVLPQTVGGLLLEHAVADNPAEGSHAVFAWRAERGIGRFGQVQWNWETVFAQHKKTMGRMGARRILHTATLDDKILEYLTRSPDRLQDQKYSF